MSIIAQDIIPGSSNQQEIAKEMDLLDDLDNHDSMDADQEPNEEDMVDIDPEEIEDAIVDEDLDMDETYHGPTEETQDIDLDDAVETTTNAVEESSLKATLNTGNAGGFDKLELAIAPDLSDLIDYADEQELNPLTTAFDSDQVHHSANGEHSIRKHEEALSKTTNNESAGEGTSSARDLPSVKHSTAIEETSRIAGSEEAQIYNGRVQDSSEHHIEANGQNIIMKTNHAAGLQESENEYPQVEQDEIAKGESESLSNGEDQARSIEQGNSGGEDPTKVSTHIPGTAGYEENENDLSPTAQHLHPITILFQETEMSLFPPSDSEVDSSETFLLQDVKLASEPLSSLFEACRSLVGESIDEHCELEVQFHDLELVISETHVDSAKTTLVQLLNVYLDLRHNDGISNPGPLYIELSSKPDFRRHLQYLEESAIQGRGLTECVSQDLSENNEEVLSPEASDSGAQPIDDSSNALNDQEEAEERLDNNGDITVREQEDAVTTHLTSPLSEPTVHVKALETAETPDNDLHVRDEKEDGDPQRASMHSAIDSTEALPGSEADEGPEDTSANHTQEDQIDMDELLQEPLEEPGVRKSSAGSSALIGELVEAEEDITGQLEGFEDSNEVDEGEIEDFDSQLGVESNHESANHDPDDQHAGHTEETEESFEADPLKYVQYHRDRKIPPAETQGSEDLASGSGMPRQLDHVHFADNQAQPNVSTLEAEELEQDIDYGQEYEDNDYEADPEHQEWPEEHPNEQSDHGQPEQEPIEGLHNSSEEHANGAKETPRSHAREHEQGSKRSGSVEDLADERPESVKGFNHAKPGTPKPIAISESQVQSSTPHSRKRHLQSDEEEHLIEDFEITPKRVKST